MRRFGSDSDSDSGSGLGSTSGTDFVSSLGTVEQLGRLICWNKRETERAGGGGEVT